VNENDMRLFFKKTTNPIAFKYLCCRRKLNYVKSIFDCISVNIYDIC